MSSKRRSFFGRSSLLGAQSIKDDDEPANLLRKRRTASIRTTLSAAGSSALLADDDTSDGHTLGTSPTLRSPVSSGSGSGKRASSVFGMSLKTPRLPDEYDDSIDATFSRARTLSNNWIQPADSQTARQPLLHGEVQTSSSMFRKKKEYLVLTESHLMRFKSYQKASEAFPMYVSM